MLRQPSWKDMIGETVNFLGKIPLWIIYGWGLVLGGCLILKLIYRFFDWAWEKI